MSATDELRRILDERGIEYETDDAQVSETEWYYVTKLRDGYRDRWTYEEPPDCDLLVSYQYDLGAEDAIAATLGDTDATPTRQDVAATVGRGTCEADETETIKCWVKCKDEPSTEHMELIHVMECSECGHTYEHVNGDYEFCPRCGRKRVDA